jgi:hypothetical protein
MSHNVSRWAVRAPEAAALECQQSVTYNAAHTYVVPLALGALALAGQWPLGVQLALIWFAHISMDRMVGYGLKYPTAFKDTHLQRV